jgi:protein-disulfide isomerase
MQLRFVILFGLLLVLPVSGLRAQAPEQSSRPATAADDTDEFGQRVRSYLLRHPEVLMEAAQILQERQRAALVDQVKQTIAARSDEIFRDPSSPVGGNPNGDVVLVEFFDYNCRYCRSVASTVTAVLQDDPGIRLVYKEFPILGPSSDQAARIALAAHRQGKYALLHDALMQLSQPFSDETLLATAASVGLDVEQLRRDVADPAIAEAIGRNMELAAALGITGTPAFVIGGEVIPGSVDRQTLEGLVAQARKG